MNTIGIVDLGIGNIRSVQQAVRFLGGIPVVVRDPDEVAVHCALILPGVGSFGAASSAMRRIGFSEAIVASVEAGHPLLGICLGMQLLATEGEEGGPSLGLGLIPGVVKRFAEGVRVPHVGWNNVAPVPGARLFRGIPPAEHFYFVHSYYLEPADPSCVAARADYSGPFPAAVSLGNVSGVQFHPEKSYRAGLRLMSNFLESVPGQMTAGR
ncbi:MAG: imidazole glycerol phosphate synthase subunit HisH [Bacillota bacterium]